MMKSLLSGIALFSVLLCSQNLSAQVEMPVDTAGYEYFTYEEGDTTYLMKKYFVCFLKSGPVRSQNEQEAMEIQTAHLAHLEKLALSGKICMVGPYGDNGEIRGMTVYSTKTQAEAEELANADPAVKAGRLVVEIHPWWAAVGSKLF